MPRLWKPDGNHDDTHQPVPTILDCDSPEPRDADFVAKTHRELGRLVGELTLLRRGIPAHKTCDDRWPCRFCKPIRDKHAQIDDHLAQLETA